MQDIPEDIAGILPIGHLTRAQLQQVCTRFRRVFAPIPVETTAEDWMSDGRAVAKCGRITIEICVDTWREWIVGDYYGRQFRRQVTRCRHVWYGATHGLNLGRYNIRIRDTLMEIFGPSLVAAPIFFVEVPRWWDRARDVDLDRAVTLGVVRQIWSLRRVHLWPITPGCIVSVGRRKYWGKYEKIFHRAPAGGCVYIHVCAHVCGDSCGHGRDITEVLPVEILSKIISSMARPGVAATVSTRWCAAYSGTSEAGIIRSVVGGDAIARVRACIGSPAKMEYLFLAAELYLAGNVAGLARKLADTRGDNLHALVIQLQSLRWSTSTHDPDGKMADFLQCTFTLSRIRNYVTTFICYLHYTLVGRMILYGPTESWIALEAAIRTGDVRIVRIVIRAHLYSVRFLDALLLACELGKTAVITYLSMYFDDPPPWWPILTRASTNLDVIRAFRPGYVLARWDSFRMLAVKNGARDVHEWLTQLRE